ncbi:MAG: glycosyltransferase family 39 protein [Elusimicrobia bacterium]|nr:glycosyltransferase family 39 protein [Elusimicrobiota bacterium]
MRGEGRDKFLILAALAGIYFYHGREAIIRLSPTYDEPFHLTAGYVMAKNRDYRYQGIWHPPLAELAAALPLRLAPGHERPLLETSHPAFSKGRNYEFADFFFYHNNVPAQKMLRPARAFHWLIFLGALIMALAFLSRNLGTGVLFWSLALLAIEPNLLAHGTLVTTDFSGAVFYAALWAAVYFFIQRPSGLAAMSFGAVWALSLTSKYTNALAVVPAAFIFYWQRRRVLENSRLRRHLAVGVVSFVLVVIGIYQGTNPVIYWKGLGHTFAQVSEGRSSFFGGEHRIQGWRLYYLGAFFLKSNLAHLAALAMALGIMCSKFQVLGFKSKKESLKSADQNFLLTNEGFILCGGLLLAGFHFLMASVSKVQIGLRYILPVYPFVILSGGWALSWLDRRRNWARFLPWAVIAGGSLSLAQASPWFVSYFNELSGGANGGYRFLTDSNNDWGQGLGELSSYLKERGIHSVYLSYFGTGDPNDYGVSYIPVGIISNAVRNGNPEKSPIDEKAILFVISWTNYQATYYADKTVFDWLKKLEPAASLAQSLFVFELTDRSEALVHLADLLEMTGQQPEAARLRAGAKKTL